MSDLHQLLSSTRTIPYSLQKSLNIVEDITKKERPQLIICGASSYSQDWDYKGFREIADKYNCILMCDMAHTAGIIAKNTLNNPLKYCHIVTSTTQKTLRGPRGGIILMGKDFESNVVQKYKNNEKVEMMSNIINRNLFLAFSVYLFV